MVTFSVFDKSRTISYISLLERLLFPSIEKAPSIGKGMGISVSLIVTRPIVAIKQKKNPMIHNFNFISNYHMTKDPIL